jgi:hypothetical protein
VEVERSFLVLANNQQLFGIRLLVSDSLKPVAQAENDQATLFEPTRAEIGQIPPDLVPSAIARCRWPLPPIRRRPSRERGELEPVFSKEAKSLKLEPI